MTEPEIVRPICEYRTNPLGINVQHPRLGWQMQTDRVGAKQRAYHIHAATSLDKLNAGQADMWDSGRIDSDQSVHVVTDYPSPLISACIGE